jgi:PhzF family phenazine biosynthesis protein
MKTLIVDAFTDRPFRGNPAGVCIVDKGLSDEAMLRIAQELNLSETAFIQSEGGDERFKIRYFSPKMEIPLCGHATLAAARAVFAIFGHEQAHFITINGDDLSVQTSQDRISMVFPIYETRAAEAPAPLLAALGIKTIENAVYNDETKILLIEIADTRVLSNLNPDFAALYHAHDSINGVLVTAPSGKDGYDFHSRYFWPWSGTDEDPVTGGTHTFLAKYWSERLGKTKLKSYQSSKRSGFMDVELKDGKLIITSQAIIVLEGMMFV